MQALRPAALHARAAPRQAPIRSLHTRPTPRAPRTIARTARTQRRYATTDSPAATGGGSGALAGGVAGGLVTLAIGYGYYRFSGAKSLVDSAHSTRQYIDSAFKQTTEKAPKPSEAVQWLRQVVTGYTKFIPGANHYVDTAFSDIEKVQDKHGDEVNNIIKEAYDELKDVTKAGASMEAAVQAWSVLQKAFKKIGHLAGDAAEDIMDNHPQLKETIGPQYQQLRQMAKQYGPEAQKQFDDTYKQVQDIVKGGLSSENISKVQKLVEEKTQELRKYGDKAWEEGMKRAGPMLEKQPELKKFVEENKDKLLKGDLSQLWQKVQSGNTDDIKSFVQDQVQKGSQSIGGSKGIESLLSMFPGGKDVGQKLSQLQELSQKHGGEAEKLIKSAFDDIKHVLDKKVEEGKGLKDKAEKDAKS
ncbi:hypothetical protein PMZ80_008186 [Knufia obscura]|uniref:Uncharacterized protein n=2 Tax=Knufia TaxID=430999 RepID=A0AAN8EMN7_9EURO|nr:hypothetical protein PMZ80_008186 [Knufia obscura]KAK5957085.1 hypothetical protein OHC33_001454 [Knufia fluminis]